MSKNAKAGAVFLTREAALAAAKKRKVKDVPVERLGGVARIRELSAGEMMDFRDACKDDNDQTASMRLLALCWVGEDDQPLFSDESCVADFRGFAIETVNELVKVVAEVNGIDAKAAEAAGND